MNHPPRILIVDRDAIAADALRQVLSAHGYDTQHASSGETALDLLERESAAADPQRTGVAIVEQDTLGAGGAIGLIRKLHEDRPDLIAVMVSGYRKVESAVQAMRLGAADYLLKPVGEAELLDAVQRAQQRHLLLAERDAETTEDTSDSVEAEPAKAPPLSIEGGEKPADAGWTPMPLSEAMKEPERRILLAALDANGWNRGETARQLDINRTTLYKKIRQYRLDEPA